MRTLRLSQTMLDDQRYRVEVAYEAPGIARRAATAEFDLVTEAQDQEDVRWYLEDYLENPYEPAPTIAANVEQRMAELARTSHQASSDAPGGWLRLGDPQASRGKSYSTVRRPSEAEDAPELSQDPKHEPEIGEKCGLGSSPKGGAAPTERHTPPGAATARMALSAPTPPRARLGRSTLARPASCDRRALRAATGMLGCPRRNP